VSVYGKKIVIDGVEYVAVPQKGYNCNDCAFCIDGIATCKASTDNAKVFEAAFGAPTCSVSYKMILKKVTPKKKPEKIKLAKVEATRGTTPTETLMAGKRSDSTAKEMASILMATSNIIKHSPFKEADKFIVCLSELDGLKPADVPKQHYSEVEAIKEAERLCKKYNQKFVVLKVVAEVEPEIKPKITKRG